MDLFAFINHADPTKVHIRKREVTEGEVMLLQLTRDHVVPLAGVNDQGNVNVKGVGNDDVNEEGSDAVKADQTEQSGHVVHVGGIDIVGDDGVQAIVVDKPKGVRKKREAVDGAGGSGLPPKKLRVDHSTSGISASTGGKSVAALQSLLEGSTLPVEVGVTAVATVPFVTTSVTPTSEHIPHDSSTNDADDEVSSIVMSLILDLAVMTTAVATTVVADTSALVPRAGHEPVHHTLFADSTSMSETNPNTVDVEALQQTYVPKWIIINDSAIDDLDVCRGVVDHLAPPLLFSQLLSMDYEQLLIEFNVGVARQTCLSSKAQLSLREAEATKAIRLRGRISTVEAAKAAQATSFLESEKDKLIDQVSQLEGTCSGLRDEVMGYKLFKEQVKAVQDEQVKTLSDRVAGLNSDLMEMALHMDEEFYPRYLTTIVGRRWILGCGLKLVVMKCLQSPEYLAALEGAIGRAIDKGMQDRLANGIDRGKAERGLVDVAAHNPFAEANYVSAINAFRFVNFPLLDQLESQKDASIADIMDLLHLEGPIIRGDVTSRCLSLADVMVSLIEPMFIKNLTGEASTFGVPAMAAITALSTTFIQASTILPVPAIDPEVSDVGPSTKVSSPPTIVFKKETLETTSEHVIVLIEYLWVILQELSTAVSEFVRSVADCFCYFVRSFPSKTKLPAILCMAGIIVPVHNIFSSRFISKASSFFTMSISDVLKVGMPISTGITASVPRAFIPSPELLFALFTKPLDCGCLTEAKTPLITAYLPDLLRTALAFSFSAGSVSSVSSSTRTCLVRWAKMVDAILIKASAFLFSLLDDPSVNSVHGSRSFTSASMGVSRESSSRHSTMKSAKICPLIDVLGLYYTLYSPSSILYFCILPVTSAARYTISSSFSIGAVSVNSSGISFFICLNATSASAVHCKSLFFVHFLKVLKNGSDFSADLERNLFRLANFPFSFCTSFRHIGDGRINIASTLSGHTFIPLVFTL
uniref:Transposase (Putative), gypsy type n=1 Tax=Tanacetum cinerariifolium TaxID=118510 RepID=A0A699H3A9_TANCI|nr:hypothetical protein [Tanacetum cinerariifolium]